MNNFVILLLLSIVVLVLDSIYIGFFIKKPFGDMIMSIQNEQMKVKMIPAILCYILIIFGIYHFIIKSNKKFTLKLIDAFILGFVVYGIYDLTNLATITNWDPNIVLVDSVWGGILYLTSSYIVLKLIEKY